MPRSRYLALLVLAGCSPVKDASNVPDAPIDSTDMRPPMIVSSVPADMATKVSVLAPISVFFDEALDPESVNADTVKLGYAQPNFPLDDITASNGAVPVGLTPVTGTVSYDEAAKKVSFVPTAPLSNGHVFTLAVDVKDHAGLAVTTSVRFITYVNATLRQFNFDGNGVPSSWVGFQTDIGGWTTDFISGNAPGLDTIWFSADDPRNQHRGYRYTPDGRIVEQRIYGSGSDGKFDTADDAIIDCVVYVYSAERVLEQRTISSAAGPDNVRCTADDVPVYNTVFTYDDAKLTGFVINTDPGPDNTWRTPDDKCAVYYDFEYDALGRKTRDIYRSCGTDAVARTADDVFGYYYQYEYDTGGLLERKATYDAAGTDGQWLTADDAIGVLERYQRNSDGQVTETLYSSAPGTDTMWGTPDDAGRRTSQAYNAQKLVEDSTSYNGAGTDLMWGTADDVIGSYLRFTYDVNGNRTDEKQFAAGGDGMWKTADDRVTVDYAFELGK